MLKSLIHNGLRMSLGFTVCEFKPLCIHKPLCYLHFPLISGFVPSFKAQERRKPLRFCCGIMMASWVDPTLLSAQVIYYKHFTTVCSDPTTCWHAGCEYIVTVEQNNK
jgi:hypothetical protein